MIEASKGEGKTAPKGRIYVVQDLATKINHYVRATSMAQAVSAATRGQFMCHVAGQEDLLGVDPKTVINAIDPNLHPDQQPLDGV